MYKAKLRTNAGLRRAIQSFVNEWGISADLVDAPKAIQEAFAKQPDTNYPLRSKAFKTARKAV